MSDQQTAAPFPKEELEAFAAQYDGLASEVWPDSLATDRAAVYRQAISSYDALEKELDENGLVLKQLQDEREAMQRRAESAERDWQKAEAALSSMQERAALAEAKLAALTPKREEWPRCYNLSNTGALHPSAAPPCNGNNCRLCAPKATAASQDETPGGPT